MKFIFNSHGQNNKSKQNKKYYIKQMSEFCLFFVGDRYDRDHAVYRQTSRKAIVIFFRIFQVFYPVWSVTFY